jgi:hypothetical protein
MTKRQASAGAAALLTALMLASAAAAAGAPAPRKRAGWRAVRPATPHVHDGQGQAGLHDPEAGSELRRRLTRGAYRRAGYPPRGHVLDGIAKAEGKGEPHSRLPKIGKLPTFQP